MLPTTTTSTTASTSTAAAIRPATATRAKQLIMGRVTLPQAKLMVCGMKQVRQYTATATNLGSEWRWGSCGGGVGRLCPPSTHTATIASTLQTGHVRADTTT